MLLSQVSLKAVFLKTYTQSNSFETVLLWSQLGFQSQLYLKRTEHEARTVSASKETAFNHRHHFMSWDPAFSTFVKKELQRIGLMSKDEILSMFHCSTSDLLQNDVTALRLQVTSTSVILYEVKRVE